MKAPSKAAVDDLVARARAARERAHAPYSRFRVGAAILTKSGEVFAGCNVENASFGACICAERNAIFHAVAEEGPAMKIATMAVVCIGHEFPPCGACRQVIAEFATPETTVCFLQNGEPVSMSMAELLPSAFKC